MGTVSKYRNGNGRDDVDDDGKWDGLGFGLMPTDYMYITKCSSRDRKFQEGQLNVFGHIQMSPSAAVLNYGQVKF